MYNQERKELFLHERKTEAEIGRNTSVWFEQAEYYEELYGRDLCDWTTTEIVSFMKYLSTPRFQSLALLKNCFEMYTNWCMSNNLVMDNQNHYTEITPEIIGECVDLNKLRKLTVSREKLLEDIKQLPNYQDQFIFIAAFEGVPTKNGYIGEIKISDLKGNVLKLHDGRQLTVSNDFVRIFKAAIAENTYLSMGKRQLEYPLEPSDTVIKQIQRENPQQNLALLVSGRFRKCIQYMGWESGFSLKDIAESGRIDLIQRMMEEQGISLEYAVTALGCRERHTDIYGVIHRPILWLKTYGTFIEGG